MNGSEIRISCKPLSHLCHINENAEFFITSDNADPVEASITVDGETVLETRTVIPPASLSASLPFPGFLRCIVTNGEKTAECGVGVDPDQITTLMQEPEDFDAFWKNSFKELEGIDADFNIVHCEGTEDFDICRLDCATVNDKRFYAMLALPRNVNKKVPLMVQFSGGEAYISESVFRKILPDKNESQLKRECAQLFFHLPPYPPAEKNENAQARHEEFLKEIGLKRYIYAGLDSPKKYYARGAILGSIRILDFVAEMPEINKNAIVFYGASHGGGFGLYYACFSKHIKAAFCGVPNFGDIAGFLAGRHPTDSNAAEFREHIDTRKYFDTAFCASRISCPVFIGVGFTDNECSPSSVYAIYNNLAGPKMIFNKIANGHGDSPSEYYRIVDVWLMEHLKRLQEQSESEKI